MVKNGSKSPVPEDWVWNESSRHVYKIVPSDRVTPGAWGKKPVPVSILWGGENV
jgi:hypothetical protein